MREGRSAVLNGVGRRVFVAALCVSALGIKTRGAPPADVSGHAGGDVTIITGALKDTVAVRSTRFR
jgi:hypothetical protein